MNEQAASDAGHSTIPLQHDLGWSLRALSVAFQARAMTAVRDLPGGPRGYLVLLAAQSGEASSQLALAQSLSIDKTQMTYLLDELQEAELIDRVPSETDRRVRLIRLTAHGRAVLRATRRALSEVEDALLRGFDDDERATLRSLLGRAALTSRAESGDTQGR